ncbi:MAG TPA: ABC transporter permease [Geminicoccus sp.]|uniref:ABC transporter permease n=1 Tax=Geminicoccus sp. TaxID=2024832 RepID=UPI002E357785|nr:ABC transporter permease [Geminicoccus sp.]HEX2527571.1 ABC transporter permease [Geminicoccus sp.]
MFNPWPFVWADLRQSLAGTLAVVVLVALAVGLGVAVSAQERALRQGSARAADAFDLIIGARGSETQLVLSTVYLQPAAIELIPGRLLAELERRPDVTYAAPIGFGDNWRGHAIVGSTPAFVTRGGRMAPAEGRVFERLQEVVVGADVPLQVGDRFEPSHGQLEMDDEEDHHGFTLAVVGRLARQGNPWDKAILVPIEAVWWVHSLPLGHQVDEARLWPQGPGGEPDLDVVPVGPPWDEAELPGVPAIAVKPATFAAAYGLRSAFRSNERGTIAVFPAEVLVQLYARLGDVRDLVAVISVLTQVLVIGAVLLAVLASLSHRRRLIGVMRALGASRAFVFSAIWLSVALMLTGGALLGLLVGWASAFAVSALFEQRTSIALPVALGLPELWLVAGIVVIGLVLAILPAALAYRSRVADALRA